MSKCPEEKLLLAFFSGDLPEPAEKDLEQHIDECSACRQVLAELARQASFSAPLGAPAAEGGRGSAVGVPGPERLGRYELLSVLGAGGMGIVYEAHDPEIDRRVAIKLVRRLGRLGPEPAELQRRLEHEARAMARVSHPNTVAIHDVGVHDGQLFIVMHHVAGQTLRQWLAEPKHSRSEILEVFLAAGEGLCAVHDAGLVHGDFKPDNVLVGDKGSVWLSDFGLSRLISEVVQPAREPSASDSGIAKASESGNLVGTPAYLAPESFAGAAPSVQSDQYAFCIALYEALRGNRPAVGPTGVVVPARLAGPMSCRLAGVLRRGLRRDPKQRFVTMHKLLFALRTCTRPAQVRRAAFWGAALVGLGVLFGGGRLLRRESPACPAEASQWVGIWDDARRQRVQAVLTASDASYAKQVAASVAASLDRYVRDGAVLERETCLAARVRHDQPPELIAARWQCLGERRQQVSALIEILSAGPAGDRKLTENAVTTAEALPQLADCADPDALLARTILSEGAEPEGSAALRLKLAQAVALRRLGRYKEALREAEQLSQDAARLGWNGFLAELEYEVGLLHALTGKFETSSKVFDDSFWHALSSRRDRLAVDALLRRAYNTATLGSYSEGLALSERARGLLRRIGHAPEQEKEVDIVAGSILGYLHRTDEAMACMQRAFRLTQERFGSDSLAAAKVHLLRGVVQFNGARMADAAADQQRAVEIYARTLGESHPFAINARRSLGETLFELGRYEDSRLLLEPMLPSSGRSAGGSPGFELGALPRLSMIYAERHEYQKAEALARRAEELVSKRTPPIVRDRQYLLPLAEALRGQKRYREALVALQSLTTLLEKEADVDEDVLSMAIELESGVHEEMGELQPALTAALRALSLREHVTPGQVVNQGSLLARISRIYERQQRANEAQRYRERAVAAIASGMTSARSARAAFTVARVLPRGDGRACTLAEQAESLLAAAKEPDRTEIRAWREMSCPGTK